MRIAFATSECVPFVKTGGLADVSGALPKALAKLGHQVKVFLPLYQSISVVEHGLIRATELQGIPVSIGDKTVTFDVWYGHLPNSEVEVYLVDCPLYYHRPTIYTNDPDEDERFILLQHAVFQILQRYAWAPDILHANDWQTALIPVYLKKNYSWDRLFDRTASLLTIHNIGYQGRFPKETLYKAGLSDDLFYPMGPYELEGAFSFLKAGIVFADVLNTVSPTYAREIQTPEFGAGLDGVLRMRSADLYGILNGIDTEVWNPARDRFIVEPYDVHTLEKKQKNKEALLEEMGLPYASEVPVIGIIARFTYQKGLDLLKPILESLLRERAVQFVVLGSGEQDLEDFFAWAARTFTQQVAVYLGYNEPLSHRIEAGSDMFLMPSRYEPCGLNQMYSLNYGTVPIVRKTGGLADTVFDIHEYPDIGNGFSFVDISPYALYVTINRALDTWPNTDLWRTMQYRGMTTDFSWERSARAYEDVYHKALAKRRG